MQRIENIVFGLRAVILAILAAITITMLFFAVQLRMDAGFLKMLPVGNSFIQTYFQYADGFRRRQPRHRGA